MKFYYINGPSHIFYTIKLDLGESFNFFEVFANFLSSFENYIQKPETSGSIKKNFPV